MMLTLVSCTSSVRAEEEKCFGSHIGYASTDTIHFLFTDITGKLREIIIPSQHSYGPMTEGLVFDGSSIPGYRNIDDSDQLLMPQQTTAGYLRVGNLEKAYVFCNAHGTDEPYTVDSRKVLEEAVDQAAKAGYSMSVGAEIEFFLTYPDGTPADMFAYCQACDDTQYFIMLEELIDALRLNNIPVEKLHKEVGAGQYEIVLHHDDPMNMADMIMLTRHIIKLYASRIGLRASFAPKPYDGRNGSAMHIHFSLSEITTGNNVFAADEDCSIGIMAQHAMAGILHRVEAGTAFLNPTHNSFDRLQPGYEAPVAVCWSYKNRSALIRVPEVGPHQHQAARAEIRSPDSSSNPYLVFSFLLHASLDGMLQQEKLGPPVMQNVFKMSQDERQTHGITMLPDSREKALEALTNSDALKDAFGSEFIDHYIATMKAS